MNLPQWCDSMETFDAAIQFQNDICEQRDIEYVSRTHFNKTCSVVDLDSTNFDNLIPHCNDLVKSNVNISNTFTPGKDVYNTRDNSSNKQPKLIHDEITNKSHEHFDEIENQIGMLPMYSNHEYTVENNASKNYRQKYVNKRNNRFASRTRCIMMTNVPELDSPKLHKRILHDKRIVYDNLTKAFSTDDNLKLEISNAVVIHVGQSLDGVGVQPYWTEAS
ncbi:hypothetical protein GJ496_006382 [Pomphorhynchus laevis]|nr:hypothetical protein GJ496_006382 [Pomphorhynchus laevis]